MNFTQAIPHSAVVSSEKDLSGRCINGFVCRHGRAEGKQMNNALKMGRNRITLKLGTVKHLMWASTFSLYLCQDTAIGLHSCRPKPRETVEVYTLIFFLWISPQECLWLRIIYFFIFFFHKNQQSFSSIQLIIDTHHFTTSPFYLKHQS